MNIVLPLDQDYLHAKYPVSQLLVPDGGVLGGVFRVGGEDTAPDFEMANSSLGNLTAVFPHVRAASGEDASGESIGGSGADVDPELAWLRAVMEGAERYATFAYAENEFVVASGNELGHAAIDLDTVPRCSAREYADPRCPLVQADKSRAIRWVRGWSLVDGCERFVPAVMTHLYFRPTREESFWQMISTGVAAHMTLAAALNAAICEVIERDAIALTWLARLPLPRIEVPKIAPAILAPNLERLRRSPLQHHGFDATTDIGVPCIYAVQTLPGHPLLSQYVNCATDFDAAAAYAKTIREAGPARTVFERGYTHPVDINDFVALEDGAAYMGVPARAEAFEFLLNTSAQVPLDEIGKGLPSGDGARLQFLVGRLRKLGTDVIAVDLTTRELRQLGVRVVRVVIPGLMPMSSIHRARFLGHPRLYQYPRDAGYGVLTEREINPYPQPFA
ncbi:YcaO-like family protein [Xanthomonas sp. MUS 060]|uniref:YcaO-like family protein n=1 Tax=Xanthomonas sp. MUS 060 TaxID=1588031 RepID=UPI0006983DF7|nr:YcaO-like family protein [Xanthomonas sp. MUS 060]